MKLKRIKAIYLKIWLNLIWNLDQNIEKVRKRVNTFDIVNSLYVGRELLINVFKSGIFPVKEQQGKELKILTPT